MLLKYGTDEIRIANFNEFENAVKAMHPHKGVLSDRGFRQLLIPYFYYNEIEDDEFEELKFSELDVVIIMDGKPFLRENLENGVYIKIGPRTSVEQIKAYLVKNRPVITSAQKLIFDGKQIPLARKPKLYRNFKRDRNIAILARYSKKTLHEFGGKGNTKEEVIADLLKQTGFNKGILNSGVVKMVIQRRRKMIRALE